MFKIAPEGWPFVAGSTLLAAALAAGALACHGAWSGGLALLTLAAVVLALFMLYFFRDPERRTPAGDDLFISPADGRIIVVADVVESRYFQEPRRQVSIFMSPLNVHVNRAPCAGSVISTRHNTGRHFAAYREGAALRNENSEMVLETRFGRILVRQVAGFLARRTVCRVGPGAALAAGERFGLIKFSSRVDVYLPAGCVPQVKVGDPVRAGETVLAVMGKK
jgi:phosphatidylserine decarboxylase